jgi:hypothetical protein
MSRKEIAEFAVVGHPNEGKSSVLSTLAEDDSVRISPMPGETRECQTFPVTIDGEEIIRFTDTPGFQNPRKTLLWMQEYRGSDDSLIPDFIASHEEDPRFGDDCKLLQPLMRGAGIIFVVDGSRPLRNTDRAEMEILRLTGCPRMAIINCKGEETDWLGKWQSEFRKHFNSVRLFNSCQATYRERIELLESLKGMDQDLQPTLTKVVLAFQEDWRQRSAQVVELLLEFLEEAISYRRSKAFVKASGEEALSQKLRNQYEGFLRSREGACQQKIRALYKHNIFQLDLPPQSILQEDLFAEKTWQFLGLKSSQLMVAGALSGAAVGAGVDVAAAGISFGVFSALGGLLGAAGTVFKGRSFLSGTRLLGMQLDASELQVGPVKNIQLFYVLLDRQLLFYSHSINWAHGRRDKDVLGSSGQNLPAKYGFSSNWSRSDRTLCDRVFTSMQGLEFSGEESLRRDFTVLLQRVLKEM